MKGVANKIKQQNVKTSANHESLGDNQIGRAAHAATEECLCKWVCFYYHNPTLITRLLY